MFNTHYANEIRFKAIYGCYLEWSEHVMNRSFKGMD